MTDIPEMFKVDELREKRPGWKLSPWTTRRLIREGKLAAVRVGRTLYVTDEALTSFISSSTATNPLGK